MEFRQMCYGIMERITREYDNLSCSIRTTSRGSFTCVLHARWGIGNEIVDSETRGRKAKSRAWAFSHAYYV